MSANNIEEPKCPANYFGKGVNYVLPDDREAVQEYERLWQEWEAAHPNDPTGEIALKEWSHTTGKKVVFSDGPQPIIQPNDVSAETSKLKLELADSDIRLLKNFASFKRRRPRDVIAELIRTYCVIR